MIISDEEYIKFIKDGQKFALEIMETIEFLKEKDKTFEDVLYIQGEDFKVTKENFS